MTANHHLGRWTGVGLVAANMIGAGVLLSTGFMAQELNPSAILVAWCLGLTIALLGAWTYGSIAGINQKSGGEYRYLSDYIHPALGYQAGWASLLIGFSAPIAVDAAVVGAFANTLTDASTYGISISSANSYTNACSDAVADCDANTCTDASSDCWTNISR